MSITLLHGDTLDILPTLAPGSVQQIITSPPYFGLRVYQIPPTAWPAVTYCPLIGLPPVTIAPMVCQLGAESDPLAYIAHLVHVFRLARPALRDDGTLWLNLADSYAQDTKWGGASGNKNYTSAAGDLPRDRRSTGIPDKNLLGIPQRAALALQADGWVWRSEIIWHAPNKMPESVRDRFTRAHEQVLLFGNGPRYYFDSVAVAEQTTDEEYRTRGKVRPTADSLWANSKNGNNRGGLHNQVGGRHTRNRRDVWSIPTSPMPAHLRTASEAHYAAWPPALVEVMIKAGSANKACAACGAAWVRQVEREEIDKDRWAGRGWSNGVADQDNWQSGTPTHSGLANQQYKRAVTTGHAPACQCNAGVGRCVVLDPFGGTGTTGAVAEQFGRDAILIDLGYQELQERRTNNLQITMEAYL